MTASAPLSPAPARLRAGAAAALRAVAPRALLALCLLLGALAAPLRAAPLDLAAEEALVLDADTGAVLLSKNAEQAGPPASMLKLMTLNMVFEALKEGRLTLDDRFQVSEKAWRMGGSKMFVEVGERVRVEDLIRGIIVLSGNDACVVVAEGMAGSEDAFAERMTARAQEIGLQHSSFGNATGWPHPDNAMSPHDLVRLARRLITEFPELYEYFAETDFEWGGVAQRNRNPLLYGDLGADGLKTGHTEEAGYGLVGSALRDGRRIIFMIGGLPDARARSVEAEQVLNWAFREFRNETLYRKGQPLGEAEVWLGDRPSVPLTVPEDVTVTLPFGAVDDLAATLRYEGPVEAPIAAGQEIAELVVEATDMEPMRLPVVAAESVPRGGYLVRLRAAAGLLMRDAVAAVMGGGEAADPTADPGAGTAADPAATATPEG